MHPESRVLFHEPRRRDRAVHDEAWMEDLLLRAPVGVLALAGEHWPKAIPNLFVFEPASRCAFLHAARRGETRHLVETRPSVSFCVFEMGRLVPAEAAVEFSVEYASVVLEGRATVVTEGAEASRALDLLMRKYAPHLEPGEDYLPVREKDLARTSVFRIDVERWSGKGKTSTAADAYVYPVSSAGAGCPAGGDARETP